MRRVRELHGLVGDRRHVLERHRAAAEQVRRAGQHVQCGDTALERGLEARVLRPHRVLRPDVGGVGRGGLVAVRVRIDTRRGIDAEVRVDVDDAGRHPLAAAVDDARARGCGEPTPDRRDFTVAQQYIGAVEPLAGAGEHRGAADEHLRGARCPIGRGEGCRLRRLAGGGLGRRRRGIGSVGALDRGGRRTGCEQQRKAGATGGKGAPIGVVSTGHGLSLHGFMLGQVP